MIPFPNKKYNIIYADPPWKYQGSLTWKPTTGGEVKSPEYYYDTLDLDGICKLPIQDITDKNCVLFIWTVNSMVDKCIEVMKAWGFNFVTIAFVWVKNNLMGLGNWTRYGSEVCLMGKRGSIKRVSRDVKQVHCAPITKHSEKPSIIRDEIVRLVGDLPRIELFARQQVSGWDSWGNQIVSSLL